MVKAESTIKRNRYTEWPYKIIKVIEFCVITIVFVIELQNFNYSL